jgi:hypothetical protein
VVNQSVGYGLVNLSFNLRATAYDAASGSINSAAWLRTAGGVTGAIAGDDTNNVVSVARIAVPTTRASIFGAGLAPAAMMLQVSNPHAFGRQVSFRPEYALLDPDEIPG